MTAWDKTPAFFSAVVWVAHNQDSDLDFVMTAGARFTANFFCMSVPKWYCMLLPAPGVRLSAAVKGSSSKFLPLRQAFRLAGNAFFAGRLRILCRRCRSLLEETVSYSVEGRLSHAPRWMPRQLVENELQGEEEPLAGRVTNSGDEEFS